MTQQEANAANLLNLWNIGEHMFDGMLGRLAAKVEKVMVDPQDTDLCGRCFGYKEIAVDVPDRREYIIVDCPDCKGGK